MKEIFSLIVIGIALSMDTFSLSLGIGTFSIENKKAITLSLIVGIMHFFMPLFGLLIGTKLINLFHIQADILLGIILVFIASQMVIDIIKHKEEQFKLNMLGMFLFAFGVSLDSFSIGLGLKAVTESIYLATCIFAICSFLFTYCGIIAGKFASKHLGVYANIIGASILAIMGIFHLI